MHVSIIGCFFATVDSQLLEIAQDVILKIFALLCQLLLPGELCQNVHAHRTLLRLFKLVALLSWVHISGTRLLLFLLGVLLLLRLNLTHNRVLCKLEVRVEALESRVAVYFALVVENVGLA